MGTHSRSDVQELPLHPFYSFTDKHEWATIMYTGLRCEMQMHLKERDSVDSRHHKLWLIPGQTVNQRSSYLGIIDVPQVEVTLPDKAFKKMEDDTMEEVENSKSYMLRLKKDDRLSISFELDTDWNDMEPDKPHWQATVLDPLSFSPPNAIALPVDRPWNKKKNRFDTFEPVVLPPSITAKFAQNKVSETKGQIVRVRINQQLKTLKDMTA